MIEDGRGDLLDARVDALVNAVNTHGVMGKGIALQFKEAFPESFVVYQRACRAGEVAIGRMFVYRTELLQPRLIVNFPTKKHWRQSSKLSYVTEGLTDLIALIVREDIRSIAVPPLGCGNGGLDWAEVRPPIVSAFSKVPDVRVVLFAPREASSATTRPDRPGRPEMTPGRAALIELMRQYIDVGYEDEVTPLEAQKVAYLLQVAGERLRLNFVPHPSGPYADGLRRVLEHMEGHFTRGYGDGKVRHESVLTLLPGAVEEARALLVQRSETREYTTKVAGLIEGFETPFGMELLATTHWVMVHEPKALDDLDVIVSAIRTWNLHRAAIMGRSQIRAAWERLRATPWAFAS